MRQWLINDNDMFICRDIVRRPRKSNKDNPIDIDDAEVSIYLSDKCLGNIHDIICFNNTC